MFTPEELRRARIFACLDEAECARLAQTIADVRLEPGEWVFREGAPAWFYVLLEGSLRIVLDVNGKQTEFPEYELERGAFLVKCLFCWALRLSAHYEPKPRAASRVWISSSFIT